MADTTWFTDDRFGMFIHWGLYSIPAGVWNGRKIRRSYSEWLQASELVSRDEYRRLANAFNPAGFDPDAWMAAAAGAGMKYCVITAKHHDGFCLWPTEVSAFNVVDATPFGRDILGELAAASERHGVKLGLYYSHWQDWAGDGGDIAWDCMEGGEYAHPTQEQFERYWQGKCLPQVAELIDRYDPWLLWFDSWSEDAGRYITPRRQDELIDLVRSTSDRCLVNSRLQSAAPSPRVDYLSMMDNKFPEAGFDKPWETSGTMNGSWAYHALDNAWKPVRQLLTNLVGNVSLGGNYQLNVGPMANGEFEEPALARLAGIGRWMQDNGEAVHGAGATPIAKPTWGRITGRRGPDGRLRLYLHILDAAPGQEIDVEGPHADSVEARVLASGELLRAAAQGGRVTVRLPEDLPIQDLPVIALDLCTTS